MGSLFEIYAGGDDTDALEQIAYAALDRVDWLEQQLSHFLPESELCRINAHAYTEPVPVTPMLWTLLLRLRQWSLETEGAFDCTAGRLVRLWGFFRRGQIQGEAGEPPDLDLLATVVQQIGWRHVELEERTRTIRFLTSAVELHLGAVGKGFIVQSAADFLRQSGVPCALLHSGNSSIVAFGAPPQSDGWPVGLADPTDENRRLAAVTLRDAALSTSGSAEQFITIGGVRTSHLFDPRTGQPVAGPASVSVISPDAADGDALSTAFCVQGVEWTRRFCQSHSEIGAIFIPNAEVPAPLFIGEAALFRGG